MRTMPSAVAPETFAGLVRGEKDALHRLFDEYAPPLADVADAEVHADIATAHIVENLFDRVWTDRATFTSPEDLHDWLQRESHVMSARELARRASLKRFDEREQVQRSAQAVAHVEYDAAAGWERLSQRIARREVDPRVAAAERFEATKHGAAEHIAHVGQGLSWKIIAGGVIAVGAVASALYWGMDRAGAEFKVTRALADKEAHAITTRAGESAAVKLDDGTQVSMAADDSITVPKAFNRDLRAVGLIGAAKFTVASNPKLPFEVRAGGMSVVATGTTFTVSAYKDAPVVVVVQAGAVKVKSGKDERDLAAGAGLVLSKDSVLSAATPAQIEEATTWADGRLVITNRTLREVLPAFRRWYLMDLRPELKLLDRQISISARIDQGDSALVALERAAHVKQIWVKGQMVVVDAPATSAVTKKRK
jgi:ferric-dicitrate binding protein FerR (iron transport regulator)